MVLRFRENLYQILKIGGILFTAWCIGFAALIIVYLIPVERIDKHVEESATIFEEEGLFPVLTPICTS